MNARFLSSRTELAGDLLVLYDGQCALCNASVKFLIDRDTDEILLFAPLQSEVGEAVLERHGLELNPDEPDSMGYVRGYQRDDETLYRKSTAVLMALDDVGGIWRVLSYFRWIPRFIRDFVYDFVAENRYEWFGKYEECRIPTKSEQERFLD